MNVKVRIKRLCNGATVPTYGTPHSAGADLYCVADERVVIAPHATVLVHTGIAIELPEGTVGLIYPRSGLATKRSLAPANKVGVIDSDYRGEIMVALHNHGTTEQIVENGERIAQLVVAPYYVADFEEADDLSDTQRGEGGFGSTGTK